MYMPFFKGNKPLIKTAGKLEKLGGVECYVATPSGEYDQSKVVLILPDVFGVPLVNTQASIRIY